MSTEVKVLRLPDCDLCKHRGQHPHPAAYDAKTVNGPWAYLCEAHFQSDTTHHLGTGLGQRLVLVEETS